MVMRGVQGFLSKIHVHFSCLTRLRGGVKKMSGVKFRRQRHIFDSTVAAMERMDLYCAAHPGSPSAARRPRLLFRNQLWIALLGPTVEEGIVGIGATVEAALGAFDTQYLAGLRPRDESLRGGLCHSRLTAA